MICARVQALRLGVGVELVEVGDAQCQIRVGEQLDGLGLGEAHEQRVDVLLDGPLLQQLARSVSCRLYEMLGPPGRRPQRCGSGRGCRTAPWTRAGTPG